MQACINSLPADAVLSIATATPIDEDITLGNRNLELTAASGIRPSFASGRDLFANLTGSGAAVIRIAGIAFVDGSASANCSGAGSASVRMESLDLTQSVGGLVSILAVAATNGCVLDATFHNNRVHATPAALNMGLIMFNAQGGTINGSASYNRIVRSDETSGTGGGILVSVQDQGGVPGGGGFRLFGNEVRGSFDRGSLFISEGLFSSMASTVSVAAVSNVAVCAAGSGGISLVAGRGTVNAVVANNTISGCARGISATRWDSGTADSRINGHVWNNVVLATTQGLSFTPGLTPALTNDHNLINAPSLASVGLGGNTMSLPIQFASPAFPRLRATSPAVNSADASFLSNVLVDYGLPATDADGLRRVKGAGVDRGAYEFGDLSFMHTSSAANTSGHITQLDHAATNGQSSAAVLPTRAFRGVFSQEPHGVYYNGSRWAIYNEAISVNMATGLGWGVWLPATGAGSFIHVGSPSNTSGASTQIDNGATNGSAGRIVLVAHNWSAQTSYNTHNIGVFHSGSGASGRWNISNVDLAALPANSAFNVYAQTASPNAFRVNANTGANRVELDHPLINGVSCAIVHATRVVPAGVTSGSGGFDVDYVAASGRWGIFSVTGFVAGTAFNVVIDPAQVSDCRDQIFAHGFE